MLEERVRIIYLSKNRSDIKEISLTWKKFCILSLFVLMVLSSIIIFSISVFTRMFHNYRIISLENDREVLQKELLAIKEEVAQLNGRLAKVETTGDELRNAAGLPPIDSDMRRVGIGGPDYSSVIHFSYASDEVRATAEEIKLDLNKMRREIQLENSLLREVAQKFKERDDFINHLPTIRPIVGARVTSPFGNRIDPLTRQIENHLGVDFAMPKGTPVIATADGIVEFVKRTYIPNKGFGKFVIINHGNGYRTYYCHLSKIYVTKGDKVKRWDPIGEVGTTGRSEGFHLHYGVSLNGKWLNPEDFILN